VAPGGIPTACRLRLTPDRVVFEPLGAIAGPGECGGRDIVLLKRVLIKDHLPIEITPAATLRCEIAETIVDWVREDLVGRVTDLGSVLVGIETLDSFECRGQNRIADAKLSEHGRANALDISAIRLKSGRLVQPTDSAVSKDFRIAMRTTVCARFTTVLGPGADGYHEDHIHVDLAERRGGYRICQWDIRDLLPDADYAQRLAAGAIPLPRPSVRDNRVVVDVQLSGIPAANRRWPFSGKGQSTDPRPQSGVRQAVSLMALRSKNKTWLTIADSAEGRYGLDTRKAGSGRFPVRKRSG
jgi:hypothetical protein